MLDLIFILLLFALAAVLGHAARDIYRSVHRRRDARAPFPYEVLRAHGGILRSDARDTFVRLDSSDDSDAGRARVSSARAARRRGHPYGARPQPRSNTYERREKV